MEPEQFRVRHAIATDPALSEDARKLLLVLSMREDEQGLAMDIQESDPVLITVADVTVTEAGRWAIADDPDLTDQQRAILAWLLRLEEGARQ
jgi:hypothetical protein